MRNDLAGVVRGVQVQEVMVGGGQMHSHSLLRGVCSDSIPGIPDRPGPGLLPPLSRLQTTHSTGLPSRAIHDTGSLRGTRLSAAPRIIPANLHRPIYFFIDRIAAGQALRLPEGQTLKDFRIKEGRLVLIYKKYFIRHILVGSPFQFPSVRIRNFLLEIMADLAGVLGAWNTP